MQPIFCIGCIVHGLHKLTGGGTSLATYINPSWDQSKEYHPMAEQIFAERERNGLSLFISGFFSERIWKGEEPAYGYPKNHLPQVVMEGMTVKTGFIAALESK